jgi:hypothetical protein
MRIAEGKVEGQRVTLTKFDNEAYEVVFGAGSVVRDRDLIEAGIVRYNAAVDAARDDHPPSVDDFSTYKAWVDTGLIPPGHPEVWQAVEDALGPRPSDPRKARAYDQLFARFLDRAITRKLDTGTGPTSTTRSAPGADRMTVRTLADFIIEDLPAREDRVQGLLPSQGLVGIVGAPKVGKSLFANQLALSVATGEPFLGRAVAKAPVLLVEEEGATAKLQQRFETQSRAMGIHQTRDLHLILREQVSLTDEEDLHELRRHVDETGAKVLVIGPLAQVGRLTSENDSPEMNRVMRTLNGLATEKDLLVVLIHHRRKDGKDGPPKGIHEFFESARGSNAYMAALDTAIGLDRKQETDLGEMYVMSRDGPAFKAHYRFDPETLLVQEADAPGKSYAKARLEDVLQTVRGFPDGVTAQQIASRYSVHKGTAQSRLEELVATGQVIGLQKGPRGVFRYAINPGLLALTDEEQAR